MEFLVTGRERWNKYSLHKSVTLPPLCHLMQLWNKIYVISNIIDSDSYSFENSV